MPDTLPPLRDDLHLHGSAPYPDGSPCWTIQDPVNNVFYRIGWLEFELLSRWHLGSPDAILAATRSETLLEALPEELSDLTQFLQENHLLAIRHPRHTDLLISAFRRSRLSHAKWLLHHYLFFRIPLWHPDRWLHAAMPWVSWIYHRRTAYVILAVGLLAILMTGRQVDTFAASFAHSLSPSGLAGYLIALAIAKSLHELGHAFTATRHGVRVAHMGVAFLVLWPVLYTDTGESWRLHNRRQRLAIASAGILTELTIASMATLAWNLATPGDIRDALFFLATTAWLISLGINASPFMRFDGYFILTDLLDLPNLHDRSFALARTWIRNHLLGWNDPEPEHFPSARRRFLILFAIATWLYRLAVFIGIAIAVYVYFFKLLGIFLFLVEIGWFVVRPLTNELKVWHQRKGEIPPSRLKLAGIATSIGLMVALVPWSISVSADAWAHGQNAHVVFTPLPSRLVSNPAGPGPVTENALLFSFDQPEGSMRTAIASAGEAALEQQLAGLAAVPEGESRRPILMQQRIMKEAQISAEADETNRLQLRAPFDGILTDVDPELKTGVWVSPKDPLGIIVVPTHWTVDAFVGQDDYARIAAGNGMRFYPEDDSLHPITGRVESIDRYRVASLPHPLLSDRHGGKLPVLQDSQGMTPRDALYRVRIHLDESPDMLAVRRGTAVIEATPRSWLIEGIKSLLVVMIREATF